MNQIKQINTGKAQLLAVMVPEIARDYSIRDDGKTISFSVYNDISREYWPLPEGNWTPLGISTELTEEQCSGLVDEIEVARLKKDIKAYRCYNSNGPFSITAKKSLQSLLEANKCYSVNPIPQPEAQFDERGNGGYCDTWVSNWQEAESNTGKWLILKQL